MNIQQRINRDNKIIKNTFCTLNDTANCIGNSPTLKRAKIIFFFQSEHRGQCWDLTNDLIIFCC